MDERRCRNHLEQNDLIREHIEAVRALPGYGPTVPIVLIPENMTGFNHTVMEEAVQGMPNIDVLYEHGKDTPGIRKTPYVSKAYTRITLGMLWNHQILFDKRWVSVSAAKHRDGERTGRRQIWQEVRDQLVRYGYDEKGKLTGKYGDLFRDDLCIAFMMLMYWSQAVEKQGAGSPYAHLRRMPAGTSLRTEHEYYQQIQHTTPGVPRLPATYNPTRPLHRTSPGLRGGPIRQY